MVIATHDLSLMDQVEARRMILSSGGSKSMTEPVAETRAVPAAQPARRRAAPIVPPQICRAPR